MPSELISVFHIHHGGGGGGGGVIIIIIMHGIITITITITTFDHDDYHHQVPARGFKDLPNKIGGKYYQMWQAVSNR